MRVLDFICSGIAILLLSNVSTGNYYFAHDR